MIEQNTILYISEQLDENNSVLAALKEKDYEVVSTNSPREGIALFFVMHSVAAVVVDESVSEQTDFDLVRSLRQIRPNVPVSIVCGNQIDSNSSSTKTRVQAAKLALRLQHLLTAESVA